MAQLEKGFGYPHGVIANNMKCYSYKVARDYGFAPNPFGGYCTLATCKPDIRKYSGVGDWVIGTGTKKYRLHGRLIFAMRISDKISFGEYWHDPRFQYKKPLMNGSLKQTYGDNIYHYDEGLKKWMQVDSHHSYHNGLTNFYNLRRDTKSDAVLISTEFYYFGKNHIQIPPSWINSACIEKQGYKKVNPIIAEKLIDWLETNFEQGYHGDPFLFEKFERYDGTS